MNYTVQIIAKDFQGNTSTIKIPLAGKESNALFSAQEDTTAYKIEANKFYKFTENGVYLK